MLLTGLGLVGYAHAHYTPPRRELVALIEGGALSVLIRLVIPDGSESERLDRALSPGPGGSLDAPRRMLAGRLLQARAQGGLGLSVDGYAVPLVLLRSEVVRRDASLGGWAFEGTYRVELALAQGAVHGVVVRVAEDAIPTTLDILVDEALDATSRGESVRRMGPALLPAGGSYTFEVRAARRAAGAR